LRARQSVPGWWGVTVVVLAALGLAFSRGDWSAPVPNPDATSADAFDSFEREALRAPLQPSTNVKWDVTGGGWVTAGGTVQVVTAGDEPVHALVDLSVPNGIVEVRVAALANNCGITFRYQDDENYWTFVAAPRYATWNVERVVDGESHVVTTTGVTAMRDDNVVSVRMAGSKLEFMVNHKIRARAIDSFFPTATTVGLTGRGPQVRTARWDQFLAKADRRVEPAVPQAP
jgi:hypothetical protein